LVKNNVVKNNGLVGILVVTYPDTDPGASQWLAQDNRVIDNKVGPGHSQADIALGVFTKPGNCFDGNTAPGGGAPTENPAGLQSSGLWSCSNPTTLPGSPQVELSLLQQFTASARTVDYKTMPVPPAQPNMPGVSGSSTTKKPTAVKGKTITRGAPLANTGVKTSFAIGSVLLALALLISRWVNRTSIRRAR